jgi:hypothetical protein
VGVGVVGVRSARRILVARWLAWAALAQVGASAAFVVTALVIQQPARGEFSVLSLILGQLSDLLGFASLWAFVFGLPVLVVLSWVLGDRRQPAIRAAGIVGVLWLVVMVSALFMYE